MQRSLATALGAAAALVCLQLLGCASARTGDLRVAPAADQPWEPPAELVASTTAAPSPAPSTTPPITAPQVFAALPNGQVSLPLAIDLALRNSPRTRVTWEAARAAAAEVGSQRSQLYPDLNFTGTAQRQKGTVGGGQFVFQQTTLVPAFDLTWLLLDFGGRAADVAEARESLVAANFSHNQAIQDVVLDVSQAFYQYVSARGLRDAAQADLDGARTNLEAAQRRHDAGLATIADVLQAKTAVSQVQLRLQTAQGDMNVIRGALATAMNLPADIPVEAAPLDEQVPVVAASQGIEQSLDRALGNRPELLAARARARAAAQRIAQERSEGLPTLSLNSNANRLYYLTPDRDPGNNYAASLQVRVPLFSGFEHHYDVAKARAEAAEENARADALANDVRLQVWTSYYDLQTAAQRFATAQDLLAAADESARVAAGRYHEGVGSILDVLTAQTALANARAEIVLARADWLLALSRLAHDTGTLAAAGPAELVPTLTAPSPAPTPTGTTP
ncbi:MAG TPA: TolC family protein [Thermoanaerobaculia bacterium]|jgi:outer membrane protein TolC|nr:TolC family protein [Thermoanaerobaculia bacterium]